MENEIQANPETQETKIQIKAETPQHVAVSLEARKMTFTFGWAGWVFGSPENAPTNIAGLAVVLSFALMGCAFFRQGDQFSESWKILVPIITAVLGYVFGKKV